MKFTDEQIAEMKEVYFAAWHDESIGSNHNANAIRAVAEHAAQLATGELQQPNVARFLANESLTKRNAELEAEISKLRAACEAAHDRIKAMADYLDPKQRDQINSINTSSLYHQGMRHIEAQLRAALEGK